MKYISFRHSKIFLRLLSIAICFISLIACGPSKDYIWASKSGNADDKYSHIEVKAGDNVTIMVDEAELSKSIEDLQTFTLSTPNESLGSIAKVDLAASESTLFRLTAINNQNEIKAEQTVELTVLHEYCHIDSEDEAPLLLDLQRPIATEENPGPFPAIVVIQGGSWDSGSYSDVYQFLPAATARGYAAISINYRLNKKNSSGIWPAQIQDAKCAVRWLRHHADELNIDPNAIGAVGYSAGAHLALMLGVTEESSFDEPTEEINESRLALNEEIDRFINVGGYEGEDDSVQAVVSIGGITELASAYWDINQMLVDTGIQSHVETSALIGIATLTGGAAPEGDDDPNYSLSSPVSYLDNDNSQLPFLFITGKLDVIGSVDQACQMKNAIDLKSNENDVTILEYPAALHIDLIMPRKADSSSKTNIISDTLNVLANRVLGGNADQSIEDTFEFLDKKLKNRSHEAEYSVAKVDNCNTH